MVLMQFGRNNHNALTKSAEGAKCESLGQRPGKARQGFPALKARNRHLVLTISRLQRLWFRKITSFPGRCPGLLHFGPLALSRAASEPLSHATGRTASVPT